VCQIGDLFASEEPNLIEIKKYLDSPPKLSDVLTKFDREQHTEISKPEDESAASKKKSLIPRPTTILKRGIGRLPMPKKKQQQHRIAEEAIVRIGVSPRVDESPKGEESPRVEETPRVEESPKDDQLMSDENQSADVQQSITPLPLPPMCLQELIPNLKSWIVDKSIETNTVNVMFGRGISSDAFLTFFSSDEFLPAFGPEIAMAFITLRQLPPQDLDRIFMMLASDTRFVMLESATQSGEFSQDISRSLLALVNNWKSINGF
jgi:hypothetical protein